MDFIDEKLTAYTESHTSPETELLKELNRETWAKVIMPRMLSGHLQGRMLSMFSHMIRPRRILEIGTYTGYSALCMAEGLTGDGKLYTIDINEELGEIVRKYIDLSAFRDKVITLTGDAMLLIPEIDEKFDLVFIDADKENYSNYYDLVFDKVITGGYIIADNVLWSGKVLNNKNEMDEETLAICSFNEKVHSDNRTEHVLFPVRDGLLVVRKISG
jgi:caffeoyl-CoA O-methyltransferase